MWCGLAISNICMNDGLTLLVAAEQSSSRCLLCYERKQVVFEIRWHCLVAAAWRGMPAPCGEATAAAAQQLETIGAKAAAAAFKLCDAFTWA